MTIFNPKGDNGVTTAGFGVCECRSSVYFSGSIYVFRAVDTIPRNGTTQQPFQLDTPVSTGILYVNFFFAYSFNLTGVEESG